MNEAVVWRPISTADYIDVHRSKAVPSSVGDTTKGHSTSNESIFSEIPTHFVFGSCLICCSFFQPHRRTSGGFRVGGGVHDS